MDLKAEHEKLYKQIPSFRCKPGCHDCCGPVVFSQWEAENAKVERFVASPTCPHLCSGRCAVYEQRPLICRLYGATADKRLACPHGCGPAFPLSIEQTDKIMADYFNIPEVPDGI